MNSDIEYRGGELLVEVSRSGFAEGFHRGSVAVLAPDGELAHVIGDPDGPIFPRSSNKPLQAVGMLRAGLTLADPADLALAAASHQGEPMHVDRVRSMLSAGGLDPSSLECPADLPASQQAQRAVLAGGGGPERVYMNCSGKHSAMLRTCMEVGWPTGGYVDETHPLQKAIRGAVEDLIDASVAATGVDGCGAPVFALSLRQLASAFLRLVSAEPGSPERLVADAMRAHPELVAGTGVDDTRLMLGVPDLLSKCGFEGVAVVALAGVGAIAVKIDDGAARARMPVVVRQLRRLGVQASVLDELAEGTLLGGGRPVGLVRTV